MSLGHAQTDELIQQTEKAVYKSTTWALLCNLISLDVQLIELMTLSEIGGEALL